MCLQVTLLEQCMREGEGAAIREAAWQSAGPDADAEELGL